MSHKIKFTRESKLTSLRGELKPVYTILNYGRAYEKLMEVVVNRKGQIKFPREEQRLAISVAENPTEEIVRTLRMDNRTVGFLVTTLEKCKLYRAADYILENILGETPPERHEAAPSHIPSGDTYRFQPEEFHPPGARPYDRQPPPIGRVGVIDSSQFPMPEFQVTEDIHRRAGVNRAQPVPMPDLEIGKIVAIPYAALSQLTNNFEKVPFEIREGRCGYISGGGFADVYYARAGKDDNLQLAIKRLRENSELSMKQLTAEVETLDGHEHPNLLPVLGYCTDGPLPCIVYKYAPLGSLRDRLACKNNTLPLPWPVRISIAKQTADVLHYLHTREPDPLIHRDVTSANILLDEGYRVLLGDFGQLKAGPRPDSGHTSLQVSRIIGVQVYMPIEAPYKTSTKLDVYAYGMVLLEILTGLPAFDDKREDEEKSLKIHVREECDESITQLLDKKAGDWPIDTAEDMHEVATEQCLAAERAERAEMAEIMERIGRWKDKP